MDNIISTAVSAVPKLVESFETLLAPQGGEENGGLMTEVAAPVEAPNIIISDQSAVAESEMYDVNDVPPALTASTITQEVGQMNMQRYVRLGAGSWTTNQEAESQIQSWDLPDAFSSAKFPAGNMMKNYIWMRSGFEFCLIVNANMGFAGSLFLVYVPDGARFEFSTFRNFPHCMVNCALNTSARLKIPYINYSQYCGITGDSDNCGTVRLMTLAKLKVPATGGQTANWTLYGRLIAPEFQVFSVLQGAGETDESLRVEEGQGAMFLSSRKHTNRRPRMGLTDEHASPDELVVGDSRVTSLREVISVESYWMALDWSYTDEMGKQLLISDVKLNTDETTVGAVSSKMNLGFLSHFFHAYKGDLVVTVQAVASRMNQGKLLLVFYPSEDNAGKTISMDNVNNAFTQIIDLGGKTSVRFTLPYVCQQTYRGIEAVHGRFAVFVLNPLTYTPACTGAVRVLFYLGAGSSFTFVYPKSSDSKFQGPDTNQARLMMSGDVEKNPGPQPTKSEAVTNIEDEAGNARVSKRPVFRNVQVKIPDQIQSDHMKLENLVGRAAACEKYESSKDKAVISVIPTKTSLLQVYKLFRYRKGDMTLHITHTSSSPVYFAHSYLLTDFPGTDFPENFAFVLGSGGVCVQPNASVSLCVPFYVLYPFVDSMTFGKLFALSVNDTTYSVFLSITFDADTAFYFMQSPPPLVAAGLGEYYDLDEDQEEDTAVQQGFGNTTLMFLKNQVKSDYRISVYDEVEGGAIIAYHGRLVAQSKKFYAQSSSKVRLQCKLLRQLLEAERAELLKAGDVEANPGPKIYYQVISETRTRFFIEHKDKFFSIANEDFAVSQDVHVEVQQANKQLRSVAVTNTVAERLVMLVSGIEINRAFVPCGSSVSDYTIRLLMGLQLVGVSTEQFGLNTILSWISGVPEDTITVFRTVQETLTDENIERLGKDLKDGTVRAVLKAFAKTFLYMMIFTQSMSPITVLAVTGLAAMDVSGAIMGAFRAMSVKGILDILLPPCSGSFGTLERRTVMDILGTRIGEELERGFEQGPVKTWNDSVTALKNLDWIFAKLAVVFQKFMDWFSPTKATLAAKVLEKDATKITKILLSADRLVVKAKQMGSLNNPMRDAYDLIAKALLKYYSISLLAPRNNITTLLKTALNSMQRITYGHRTPDDIVRVDPVAYHFCGAPGHGKTTLMTRLTSALAAALKTGVYSHAPGSEYMDGYEGQGVHYIDEFMANTDEKESSLILQLLGCSQVVVPMASLDDKGKFYTSKIMITTSNSKPTSDSKLKHPAAITRRFKVVEFKASDFYLKMGPENKQQLDIKLALKDNMMEDGQVWEVNTGAGFKQMSFSKLVRDILKEVQDRERVFSMLKAQMDADKIEFSKLQEPLRDLEPLAYTEDELTAMLNTDMATMGLFQEQEEEASFEPEQFDTEKFNRVKELFSIENFKDAVGWISTAAGLVASILTLVTAWTTIRRLLHNTEERPYNPISKATFKKIPIRQKVEGEEQQGTTAHEFAHLRKAQMMIRFGDKEVQAFKLGGRQILTYSHGCYGGRLTFDYLDTEVTYESDQYSVAIPTDEGIEMDLAIITLDKQFGIEFPNMKKHIATPIWGLDCMMVKKDGDCFEVKNLRNVVDTGLVTLYNADDELTGVKTGHISYTGKTVAGDCGSVILQKQKGAWKIIGMHNAGRMNKGRAVRMDFVPNMDMCQGIVRSRINYHTTVYQPTRSELKKSPFYGFCEVEQQPAALTSRDRRLENPPDNLVKSGAEKYRVNTFNVDKQRFSFCKQAVKERIHSQLEMSGNVSMELAITGAGCNAIDSQTSPGRKYVERGLKKSDLYTMKENGDVEISTTLRRDVEKQMEDLKQSVPSTTFTACLKDELRPKAKVKQGKTRVIEACELDYVILYRMVMSQIYAQLYDSPCYMTGIAAGMNPIAEAESLHYRLQEYARFLALDYTRFDGSLSEDLLRHAVDILAEAHEDPDLVRRLHEPVINSKHVVFNELWEVQGGMPSGSPCTTILNCICNLLVVEYCLSFFLDYMERKTETHDGLMMDHLTVVYGDDCVIAYNGPEIGLDFKKMMLDSFGMEVTPARKDDSNFEVKYREISFLKRSFKMYRCEDEHDHVTLALDPVTINQHLMWMRGTRSFPDQVRSLFTELVGSGREIYEETRKRCLEKAAENGMIIAVPEFDASALIYDGMFHD